MHCSNSGINSKERWGAIKVVEEFKWEFQVREDSVVDKAVIPA
jgi:hypothetical protein